MRIVGRIAVVLTVTVGPAVVTLIGCNVDSPFPGLKNEVPNVLHGGVAFGTGGGASASTSGTTSSTSGGGIDASALSLCDISAALVANNPPTCATCENQECLTLATTTACPMCDDATMCALNCAGIGTCIAGCISQYPQYATFLECMFTNCASSCGEVVPLACPLDVDGGGDAAGE